MYSSIPHPLSRNRPELSPILPHDSRCIPFTRFRIRPTRLIRIHENPFTDDAGVGSMRSIEVDAFPVDKFIAGIKRRETHSVVIVDRPDFASRDAARSRVETDCDSLLRDVDVFINRTWLDLVSAEQDVAEIHQFILGRALGGFRFLDQGHPAWQ